MLAWNVVKKFFHPFFEKKSNEMAAKVGIFIRSTRSSDDIIEACTNLIRNSNSGGRITAVRKDEKYGGVKVYLNEDDIAKKLIAKQFLFEKGDDLSTIHPLITHLTLHDAIISTTEEQNMIEELRNIIQEALGPVLKISKIPVSKLHPEIGNGNWRILLDVPEVEDLDSYKKSGLPDDLTVKVPGVHGRLHITFYCTKCDKDGHTQWGCSESETKVVLDSVKREASAVETPSTPSSGVFIRDRVDEEESRERDVAPINNPLLKRKNIRKFANQVGEEEVLNFCGSFHLKDSEDIKKEVGKSSSSSDGNSQVKRSLFTKEDEGESLKKARVSPLARVDDDNNSENQPKASSTTNDADSLEIVYESSSTVYDPSSIPSNIQAYYFPSPSVGGVFTRNSVDDSVSTSNQPAATVDTIKSELPSTDENESDSNQGPFRPKPVRQRKKPAQGVPIVIPDRIKTIISEIEDGVLNVDQLTAFFNHVKKKSKPCNFAEMYTRDVAGLKKQLVEIKNRYYMIPERGTNVEIQFMKWFVNILDRFDGTPSTRKKKDTA